MNPDVGKIAQAILKQSKNSDRVIAAIAGPPGAGKSTFADALRSVISARGMRPAVVPMDGFHLDNAILDARGIRPRKGAPFTFDATGFLHLLERLKATEDETFIPVFDRERDIAIAGAQCVTRADGIVLVEGNYLLVDDEPWARMRPLFDLTVFLDPGMDVLRRRLIDRWVDHDHTLQQAENRASLNDLPNAEYVLARSSPADFTLRTADI